VGTCNRRGSNTTCSIPASAGAFSDFLSDHFGGRHVAAALEFLARIPGRANSPRPAFVRCGHPQPARRYAHSSGNTQSRGRSGVPRNASPPREGESADGARYAIISGLESVATSSLSPSFSKLPWSPYPVRRPSWLRQLFRPVFFRRSPVMRIPFGLYGSGGRSERMSAENVPDAAAIGAGNRQVRLASAPP